ncbi:MAG: hypothetical protein SF097_05140 [Acidobacteriota bacterium]|nr:hypothetical protein [Acidobacteriota bacterium]
MCKKIVRTIFVMLSLVVLTPAQPSDPISRKGSVKIDTAKPSVFISFVERRKREPIEASESNEGIWLRIVNNSKWTIWLPSFGVPKGAGDIGVHYVLESLSSSSAKPKDSNCPPSYDLPHPASFKPIKPGKSALFSLPSNGFTESQRMRIFFFYDWESLTDVISNKEPRHYVYFSFLGI